MLNIVAEQLGGRNEEGWQSLGETIKIKHHNITCVDTASGTAFNIL